MEIPFTWKELISFPLQNFAVSVQRVEGLYCHLQKCQSLTRRTIAIQKVVVGKSYKKDMRPTIMLV